LEYEWKEEDLSRYRERRKKRGTPPIY